MAVTLRMLVLRAFTVSREEDEVNQAATILDVAQAALRERHGIKAARQLHAAAQALCAPVGDRAAQVRDRLEAAGLFAAGQEQR